MRPYNVLMPWRASSAMEEKLRFVFEYERDEETMRELCSRYAISRETGYVWLRRYRKHGARDWWKWTGLRGTILTRARRRLNRA